MKFRGLDSDKDWMMGQGLGSYAKDANAIALDIETTIKSWYGNCFFDLNAGIDWANRLDKGQRNNLLVELRNAILGVNGVVRINSLSVNLNATTRNVSVSYNVNTIYTQSFQTTLNVLAGGAPNA